MNKKQIEFGITFQIKFRARNLIFNAANISSHLYKLDYPGSRFYNPQKKRIFIRIGHLCFIFLLKFIVSWNYR